MANENKPKRIAFTIEPRMQQELQVLKKNKFFDVPWSSLYRIVMAEGIKTVKEKK